MAVVTTAKKRKMSCEEGATTPPHDTAAADECCGCRDNGGCGATATTSAASMVSSTTQTLSPHDALDRAPADATVAISALPVVAPPAYKTTFHRRVLPQECIAFSSAEGRQLFTEAITTSAGDSGTNYMQIYFPLAEQFTTQAEPAFCGLATLAMCLNALHIDPGRIWKGAWRWFSEELLDCCTPLETAKEQGISFKQFVCLAHCNGALADGVRADDALSLERFREIIKRACASSDEIVVLNYTRKALEQTGDGHFSPIGGYNATSDMVLLLDVARFKYPPHWVRLPLVFEAIQRIDKSSGLPRGLVVLRENTAMTTGVTPANQVIASRKELGVAATQMLGSCCARSQSVLPSSTSLTGQQ